MKQEKMPFVVGLPLCGNAGAPAHSSAVGPRLGASEWQGAARSYMEDKSPPPRTVCEPRSQRAPLSNVWHLVAQRGTSPTS